MKTIKLFFLLPAVVLILVSCSVKCKKGEGPRVTKTRNIEAVSKLVCDIPCVIYVSQGNIASCTVEAAENLQDLILIEPKGGGKVKITSGKCFSDLDSVIVRVVSPELREIKVKGAAKVFSGGAFTADDMRLTIDGSGAITLDAMLNELVSEVNGAGDINLKGSAQKHKIILNGSGNISASEFNTYDCQVQIEGSGTCHLFVNNNLKADIEGSGNVFYKGSPRIKTDIKGSGKVEKE